MARKSTDDYEADRSSGMLVRVLGLAGAAAAVLIAIYLLSRPGASPDQAEPMPTDTTIDTRPTRGAADCDNCPSMVQISPGSVTLGLSAAEALVDSVTPLHMQTEIPARRVNVTAPFMVSSTEVTNGQFADFVAATGHVTAGCTIRMGSDWIYDESASWRDPGFHQTAHHPVVCVSYEDAAAYADWLAQRTLNPYRLITEVEWEYIARADAGTSTPWTGTVDQACRHGNVAGTSFHNLYPSTPESLTYSCDTDFAQTAPVGRFDANPWGLYDLFGNARERIASCWTPDHKETPPAHASENETDCEMTIVKGGGWSDPPANLRVPRRLRALPTERRADTGFRVVKELSFLQEAE